MTHFERDYLINKQRPISYSLNRSTDLTQALSNQKEQLALQMNYRELDRLAAELQKEINSMRMLRSDLEKYKVEFNLQIENEATKKIEEVVNTINRMFT